VTSAAEAADAAPNVMAQSRSRTTRPSSWAFMAPCTLLRLASGALHHQDVGAGPLPSFQLTQVVRIQQITGRLLVHRRPHDHERGGHFAGVAEVTDRLDQLVHCAVDTTVRGPILELDPDRFARAVQCNGSALVHWSRPRCRCSAGSAVVFVISRGSQIAVPGYGAEMDLRRAIGPLRPGRPLARLLALRRARRRPARPSLVFGPLGVM
jgi:hypothetical protein